MCVEWSEGEEGQLCVESSLLNLVNIGNHTHTHTHTHIYTDVNTRKQDAWEIVYTH